MKKTVIVAFLVIGIIAIAGYAMAGDGPAPNAGDGEPDGSGFEEIEPNGEGIFGDGHAEPAPNAGDGISDGPGWE